MDENTKNDLKNAGKNAIKTGKCFRNIIADQYKMRGLQRDVQSEQSIK